MKQAFKLMILSVGSLVGQGLLDLLEDRRADMRIIGLNSQARNPSNFRCDSCYLTPLMEDQAYQARLEEILALEQPDLILPGRDDDVLFLARYKALGGAFADRVPCGSPAAAQIVQDKYLCWQWANEQGLPFANSFLLTHASAADLAEFTGQCGFPLIAKPRQGFGSHGVYFVRGHDDLARLMPVEGKDLLLQEYLPADLDLEAWFRQYTRGIPLFFQIPEPAQFAAQTLIGPDGSLGPICCSISAMVMGRVEVFRREQNPALEALMKAYCHALSTMGWRGNVNLQARPDARGQWKVFELNLRL